MLDKIEIDPLREPIGNWGIAKEEIMQSLIKNGCSIASFKYIVDEILKDIINNHKILAD